MPATHDPITGNFVRTHQPWTPETWDDGFLDNRGRFRVYRPDYPNAYKEGYALRAHIVWWLATGEIRKGQGGRHELHHRDGNKLNDRIENLVKITRSEHRFLHDSSMTLRTCMSCGGSFAVEAWRIRQGRGKICSLACYWAHGGRWQTTPTYRK